MVNDDVYVVEIIEQYNIDDPSCVADFNTYTKLFRDLEAQAALMNWLEK